MQSPVNHNSQQLVRISLTHNCIEQKGQTDAILLDLTKALLTILLYTTHLIHLITNKDKQSETIEI